MRTLHTKAALPLLIVLSSAYCGSFKTFEINSLPPVKQVVIDGQADDWAGRLYVVKGQKVALGFLNDRECLYICLRTDDPGMKRHLLRSGMTVWFDPTGGKKKVLGIKYPIGLKSSEERVWTVEEPEEDADMPAQVGGNLTDVEILRQGNTEPEVMDIAGLEGVELRASASGRHFVYELRVPLAPTGGGDAVRVGVAAGGRVGIGFESAKSGLDGLARGPVGGAAGMPPVGAYGGRAGGMRPGRMRPNNPDLPEDLKIWATVELCQGGGPAPAEVRSLSD